MIKQKNLPNKLEFDPPLDINVSESNIIEEDEDLEQGRRYNYNIKSVIPRDSHALFLTPNLKNDKDLLFDKAS